MYTYLPLARQSGARPVQVPLLHVLVSKPRIINPLLQLYVATSIALAPKVMLTEPSCGGSNAGHSANIQFIKKLPFQRYT